MNNNIYILTHPLTGNYGGLLQAYASYTTLNNMGCKAHIYRYQPDDMPLGPRACWRYFKQHMKYVLGRSRNAHTVWRRLTIARRFLRGMRFLNEADLGTLKNDASFYVGSDQVWRAIYCRMMKSPAFYFLNFATPEQRQRSIAYAASFGIDEWEGTPEETAECAHLLQEFKAVSVRETSGITICREHLGTTAVQMPDPTLLLQREEYEELIRRSRTWVPAGPCLAAYVIDENGERPHLLKDTATRLDVQLQHLLPHADAPLLRDRFAPTVEQWLRLIRDCDYFITDSFHGTVFAIIFNKPFVCLGNEGRGSARFDTLLKTFGLQDRLVTHADAATISSLLQTPINWEQVNSARAAERKRGIDFIQHHCAPHA